MIDIDYAPGFKETASRISVADAEAVLSQWFDAEVILTSSGRAAILLYFTAIDLNRYRHRVAIPRMISACVLGAVIRRAFPVDAASGGVADAHLLYHQYGLPQTYRPKGRVIEDICHSFFAAPPSGSRNWCGEAAVFSLPKFFATTTLVGGLVVSDRRLAAAIRKLRDQHPVPDISPSELGEDKEAFYLKRLLNPRISDSDLGGLPDCVEKIANVGAERLATIDALLPFTTLPKGWPQIFRSALPFAFPHFSDLSTCATIVKDMNAAGIVCDTYQIDVARSMRSPRHEPAVLLPCHHQIPPLLLQTMIGILEKYLPTNERAPRENECL